METQEKFDMAAKTLEGLEETLAEELRNLGATNVQPGTRVVTFHGDTALLYRANLACRTALSVLKPIYKFTAHNDQELYERVKEFDWSKLLNIDKTFSIDTVSHSEEFSHSRFVTYRVKDGIADHFEDLYGEGKRPGVRLQDADVQINVHIDGDRVTLSLNSSGEPLYKRGWRKAQTDAPINEVLAAGILLKSGYRGDVPLVDPMCGSGTFLVEGAMIACGIWPGSFNRSYAFQKWSDFNPELFEQVKAEEAAGRKEPAHKIYGADLTKQAISISSENVIGAGVEDYVSLTVRPLEQWEEAPADGVPGIMVTNPPYGQRLRSFDTEELYATLGTKLKHVFLGYHAWVISSNEDCLAKIGLAPSTKEDMNNGGLDCQLREYVIFEGSKSDFRQSGGAIKDENKIGETRERRRRPSDEEWKRDARKSGLAGDHPFRKRDDDRDFKREDRPFRKRDDDRDFKRGDKPFRKRDDGNFKEKRFDREKAEPELSEAEQILNRRRNPALLKLIGKAKPSIPGPEPKMRSRKKKD